MAAIMLTCHTVSLPFVPTRHRSLSRFAAFSSAYGHRQSRSQLKHVQRSSWRTAAAAAGADDSVVCDSCGDATSPAPNPSKTLRVAVVGDVHGQWNDSDLMALHMLNPDITLFVGDFGEEDLDLVKKIAALPINKAVILGNHDAWYTMTDLGLKRRRRFIKETKNNKLYGWNKVKAQLAELGDFHVGYSGLPVPGKHVSVVGSRPFSKGGSDFDKVRSFCQKYFQVDSLEASARKILAAAIEQPKHHSMIVMGHNGPFGLGSERFDICGLDFQKKGGDFGDPDLQSALDLMFNNLIHVPLVVFGHMHERLKTFAVTQPGIRGGGTRRRVYVHPNTGSVMVNAAVVPRTKDSDKLYNGIHIQQHHFVMVELVDGDVVEAKDVWVEVNPSECRDFELDASSLFASRLDVDASAGSTETWFEGSTATSTSTQTVESTNKTFASTSNADSAWLPTSSTSAEPSFSERRENSGQYTSTSEQDPLGSTSAAHASHDSGGHDDTVPLPSPGTVLSPASTYRDIPGCRIVSEQLFLQTVQGVNGGVVKMTWDGYRKTWKAVFTRPWSEIRAQKQQDLRQRAAGAAHYAATHGRNGTTAALDWNGSQAIISRGSWQEAHRAACTAPSSTGHSSETSETHSINGVTNGVHVVSNGTHYPESNSRNGTSELLSKPVPCTSRWHDSSNGVQHGISHNGNGTVVLNGENRLNGTHSTSNGVSDGPSRGRRNGRSRRRSSGSRSGSEEASSRSKPVGFGKGASKGKENGNGVKAESAGQQTKSKGFKELSNGSGNGEGAVAPGPAAPAAPKKVRVRMGVSLVAAADK